jgi:hypothetical protein
MRYRNGCGPTADCCDECRLRIYLIMRSRERSEYRTRDHNGRIIADWLL